MQRVSILTILALACSCALASDATLNEQWNSWKQNHKKRYSDDEEHVRRNIWEHHLQIVQEHNLQADLGVHTYWLGMNRFADLTNDEFVKVFTAFNDTIREKEKHIEGDTSAFHSTDDIPDSFDWREKGCVSSVHDQGQCGADAIFVIVDSIEGISCRITGKLVPLSLEQVLDCSGIGCTGTTPEQVYQYIAKAGGLESAASYPPTSTPGPCRFDPTKIAVQVSGFVQVQSRVEKALQAAVATVGPIAVAIDASHTSFQLYRSGVYDEPRCSPVQLDHAVLVVGYGSQSNIEYWIVKNSWGATWGDGGYILMARNKKNQCGIATDASYANL